MRACRGWNILLPGQETRVEGGDIRVTKVVVKEGEPFEKALKRFKKKVEAAGILKEVRRREHYLKPSIRKKEKQRSAEKRRRRSANRSRR
jgi:small subunit ribosomal protein S21